MRTKGSRERGTHGTVDGVWGVEGWSVGVVEDTETHRGLTTSENRLGLKIKHYVIGVGV